jgi:hypothetical protein
MNASGNSTLTNRYKNQLVIRPRNPIPLTDQLDLKTFLENTDHLNFIGLDGIEVWPWKRQKRVNSLNIQQSSIDFYINGSLSSKLKCSKDLIPLTAPTATFFNLFMNIEFNYKNTFQIQPICPYIFTYANILEMTLYGQLDTILITNRFKFEDLNASNETISSSIFILNIYGYNYELDTSLIHPLVFEQINSISIFRSIGSIQSDLFKQLKQIYGFQFKLDNFKNFFHKIGIEWTLSLQNNSQVYFLWYSKHVASCWPDAFWIYSSMYTFPDEDFCIFAPWPRQKVA